MFYNILQLLRYNTTTDIKNTILSYSYLKCVVKMMRSSTDKCGNLLSAASHQSSREEKLREHIEVKLELSNTLQSNKIRRLIREFGSLPLESRPLAWRYILKTPSNSKHFRRIVVESCGIKLPTVWSKWIKDNNDISKFTDMALKRILRWLLNWSDELAGISFLPEFVVPYVKIFSSDPSLCFEVVATIIAHWGYLWLEMQSLPPFDIMRLTEQLVQQYAPGAFSILKSNSIDVASYAWPLLECGFSQVLSFEQWSQLWDHFLCNHLSLTIAACVAYVCITESSLRSFSENNKEDLQSFYHQPSQIDMRIFLKKAYEIMDAVTNWPGCLCTPIISLAGSSYPKLDQMLLPIKQSRHKSEKKKASGLSKLMK